MSNEHQWATDLKKVQAKARRNSSIPIAVRKKQLADRMEYFKNLLLQSSFAEDEAEKNRAMDALIDLRGELAALDLEEIKSLYGAVETPALEASMQKYYEDCYRLAAAV